MTDFWPVIGHNEKTIKALFPNAEPERIEREHKERDAKERADREWAQLRALVLADEKAADEEKAAEKARLAAMSAQQLAAHYRARETQIPQRTPPRPKFYYTAKAEIEQERRERERALTAKAIEVTT
jgi:hypothetical protein